MFSPFLEIQPPTIILTAFQMLMKANYLHLSAYIYTRLLNTYDMNLRVCGQVPISALDLNYYKNEHN